MFTTFSRTFLLIEGKSCLTHYNAENNVMEIFMKFTCQMALCDVNKHLKHAK